MPLAVTFLAEFTSLTSFLLLLSVMPMLAAAAGFGLSGVVAGALTAKLLPPERRGEGLGLICVSTGYPAAFALTGALILATLPAALRERKATVPALAAQPARRLDV